MALYVAMVPLALAERADRNKPIFWEADVVNYDDIKQANVLKGSAVITKGTLVIHAEQILITQDPQGYQFGTATGTDKGPATFKQKRDATDQTIEGTAEQIEYDGKNDRIVLTGHAVMKRLEASTATDEATGDVIIYDNRSDQYQVTGKRDAKSATGGGRARGMIAPRTSPTGGESPDKPVSLKATTSLAPTTTEATKQ
jgi:lipopolysaccharide export system protein LptA